MDEFSYFIFLKITNNLLSSAVQNERDRINCRRPSYEEPTQANGLSVVSLLNAELLSRKVIDEVSYIFVSGRAFMFFSEGEYLDTLRTLGTKLMLSSNNSTYHLEGAFSLKRLPIC